MVEKNLGGKGSKSCTVFPIFLKNFSPAVSQKFIKILERSQEWKPLFLEGSFFLEISNPDLKQNTSS
jgi:hypothetical protein